MIAVIYPTNNRLYYTQLTLPRVVDEVNNNPLVKELMLIDDSSTDGTPEFLSSIKCDKAKIYIHNSCNSTYSINKCLEVHKDIKYIIKIDNDILVPEGYINRLVEVMEGNDELAFAAMNEVNTLPHVSIEYKLTNARWIGGVGIFRREVFYKPILSHGKYFGFTAYQERVLKQGWKAAWLDGCGNTNLDSSCWSKSEQYVREEIARKLVGTEKSVF